MKSVFDILSDYDIPVKKESSVYRAFCPLHDDKTKPNFTVYSDKGEGSSWFCFSCSVGGDAISLLAKLENISYKEAKERLQGEQDSIEALRERVDGLKVPDDEPDFSFVTNLSVSKRFYELFRKHPKSNFKKLFELMENVDKELANKTNDSTMREIVKRVSSFSV